MGTRRGGAEAVLTSTHNLCFEQEDEKNIRVFHLKCSGFGGEIFYIFEYACFRNGLNPVQKPQNAASDHELHRLPLI